MYYMTNSEFEFCKCYLSMATQVEYNDSQALHYSYISTVRAIQICTHKYQI